MQAPLHTLLSQASAYYADGRYDQALSMLRADFRCSQSKEKLMLDCLLKGNRAHEAVSLFASHEALSRNNLVAMGTRIKADMASGRVTYDIAKHKDIIQKIKADPAKKIVFPAVWPLALGDMIVFCQFVLHEKKKRAGAKSVVICPLNRPDLRQLLEISGVDYIIDITVCEAEQNRLATATLIDNGRYVLSLQQSAFDGIMSEIGEDAEVFCLRYFPLFSGDAGRYRVWEERAWLYLKEGIELPKLPVYRATQKENIITVHFRNAPYNDHYKNVNNRYAQDIINALKEATGCEIVRLGDKSMVELEGCRNASHEGLTLEQQADIIQRSRLFVGSHSSMQHFAVAVSDTPIVVVSYTTQETIREIGDNVPCLSYAPVGAQVKKIFWLQSIDSQLNALLPAQNVPTRAIVIPHPPSEIAEACRGVIDG